METVIETVCMYCGYSMGMKDGFGVSGVSHSICRSCWTVHFPEWEYPDDEEDDENMEGKQNGA